MTDMVRPGVEAAAGSQVTVIDRLQAAAPFSRPFILNPDTSLTGTATGNANVESYCDWAPTAASRYRLDRPDHNQIFHFDLTASGVTVPTYCLDKFRDGPYGDVPYQSITIENIFPDITARQSKMLAWVLANAYPAISVADTFALLGVNDAETPVLDNHDAYAVVQVAIWVLLGQIAPEEVYFLNCGETTVHPKSDRLRAAVLQLLNLAGNYADAVPTQITANRSACQCNSPLIQCCVQETRAVGLSEPEFSFRGCPSEVRTVCGRLLVGPFLLRADVTGTPTISIEPFCACGGEISAEFTDYCGNPIASPSLGQEFYLALRFCGSNLCFYLNATLGGTITRVITMSPTSTALNYQPIGATLYDYPITLRTTLCICVTDPGKDGQTMPGIPGNPSFSGVFVNNNNNNNNNSGSSTSSSSSNRGGEAGGGCPPMIFPPLCAPWWCLPYPPTPPYPPKPPYPPYPPYPPEPPFPPYPPYPPEPPYPPYPPCPPEPPHPPYPPCPSEPPCPPCPPCPPEPTCPPNPPCPPSPPCPPEPPCPPRSCPPVPPKPPVVCCKTPSFYLPIECRHKWNHTKTCTEPESPC